MLKSYSTQFAATLFFGPLGLAYSSVAAAVFLTLVLAVLLFTELGVLSLLLVWPLAILTGLVFVKFHNDQIRSSGSRLLLGPGDDYSAVSSAATWGRGIAVLALLVAGGFVAYSYMPRGTNDIGRIVSSDTQSSVSPVESAIAGTVLVSEASDAVAPALIGARGVDSDSDDSFTVIALPEREVATVVIDSDGNVQQGEAVSALNSTPPELTVTASLVNLRRGPGTRFDVITTVRGGEKLFEFARDGAWINVETESGGFTGWIYNELVR